MGSNKSTCIHQKIIFLLQLSKVCSSYFIKEVNLTKCLQAKPEPT